MHAITMKREATNLKEKGIWEDLKRGKRREKYN